MKHSACLLRYVTLRYIALRYITVNGRVRADRNDATGPRRATVGARVTHSETRVPPLHRHDEIKRCIQRHTPLTIAKAVRHVAVVILLRAERCGSREKKLFSSRQMIPELVTQTRPPFLWPLHLSASFADFISIFEFHVLIDSLILDLKK